MTQDEDTKAQARQRVILEVLAGRLAVTQAALELGVSRKTYYEWQERALSAMKAALVDRPGGRPAQPRDPEKELLLQELETVEKERLLLASRLRIQESIRQSFELMQRGDAQPKKKERGS